MNPSQMPTGEHAEPEAPRVISLATAIEIVKAHQEIAAAEKLLDTLREAKRSRAVADFRDDFGRVRNLQLGVPSSESGRRLYDVSPELAVYVVESHIAAKRKALIDYSLAARLELSECSVEAE